MEHLSADQTAFAVKFVEQRMKSRGLTQTQLHQSSGVAQSHISKILSGQAEPTPEVLRKLFEAMGLKLDDVLHEAPSGSSCEILGYLATPLTAVVQNPAASSELERVISEIRTVASSEEFADPPLRLYWPGDYTHPLRNLDFTPQQVYIMDRSRASAFDFVVLFCASPSYGVGQENEIATQGGLPAIRLISEDGVSRMISGSFLNAIEVKFSGSLETRVEIDLAGLHSAFKEVRKSYFRLRALYRGLNGNDFGGRLRRLLDDRGGDYKDFARDLGISLHYLHCLMDEPFAVSNPSVRLLWRMGVLLSVSVGYLLGETSDTDPVLVESLGTWHSWVKGVSGLDAAIAVRAKEEWQDKYAQSRSQSVPASFRNTNGAMREADWDKLYQELTTRQNRGDSQKDLF